MRAAAFSRSHSAGWRPCPPPMPRRASRCCARSAACRRTSPARFSSPIGFQQADNGIYYVFDRRGHAVYTVDGRRTRRRRSSRSATKPGACSIRPRSTSTRRWQLRRRRRAERPRAAPDLHRERQPAGRLHPAGPRAAAADARQHGAERRRIAAVHRANHPAQSARARLARDGAGARRHADPHVRHAAADRARDRSRSAPRVQRRPAARRSDRRLLLRLPGGRADLSQVRRARAADLRTAHRGAGDRRLRAHAADHVA